MTTKDQQIKNCLVLHAVLLEMPDEAVNLRQWRTHCGAVYCIGGWVTQIPYFQKQGVRASPIYNWPEIPGTFYITDVAEKLFGDPFMFEGRERLRIPQRQEAIQRVERALMELTK